MCPRGHIAPRCGGNASEDSEDSLWIPYGLSIFPYQCPFLLPVRAYCSVPVAVAIGGIGERAFYISADILALVDRIIDFRLAENRRSNIGRLKVEGSENESFKIDC